MKILTNTTTLILRQFSLDEDSPLINAKFENGDFTFTHAAYYSYVSGAYLRTNPDSWICNRKQFSDQKRSLKNSYILYCSTVFDGIQNDFIVDLPAKDKKLAQLWTIDDWNTILKLCSSRALLMDSLENVKESIGYMKRFSDIRKLSSTKQNKMKSELKTVSESLRDAINFANSKASEYQIFNA